MQWAVRIDIDVGKADFSNAQKAVDKFARDTWKLLDPIKNTKLEMNVADATLKLQSLKSKMKDFQWTIDQKKQLIIDTNNAQSNLTEAKRQLQNFKNTWDETTSRLQQKFNALWTGIGNVFKQLWWYLLSAFSIGSVMNFFQSLIKEAVDGQRAVAQLNAVIKSTWWAVWLSWKQIKSMSEELATLNGVQDDVILSTQNMLLTFTNIKGDLFKPTTQAVLDLATAMNGWLTPSAEELSKTAIQVWKAMNDPINGMTALKKVWVTFSEEQKKQIANFQKAWDVMSAQRVILAELNREFWGSAQAQLQTYAWKVQQMSTQRSNFKESLGNQIIPWLTWLIGALQTIWWLFVDISNGDFFNKIFWIKPVNDTNEAMKSIQSESEILVSRFQDLNTQQSKLDDEYRSLSMSTDEYKARTKELTDQKNDLISKSKELNKEYDIEQKNQQWLNRETLYLKARQKDLEAQYRSWKISLEQFHKEMQKLVDKTKDTVYQTNALTDLISEYNAMRLDKSHDVNELEKLRLKTIDTINEQLKLINIMQQVWVVSWIWTWFWWMNAIWNIAKQWFEAQKAQLQNKQAVTSWIQNVQKSWYTPATTKASPYSWWGGWSSGTSALEKQVKSDMDTLNGKIQESEWKWKEYQNAVEETKNKIKELRDSATSDIADINWQLKDVQAQWASDLAKRYAEVVNSLAKDWLDDTEKNKLLEEKAFLEWKVSQELRDQAVAYSNLSQAQQIYADNQQQIADLQQRQSIDKAFLSWNLKTTATWGIGIQDENDPTKIVEITNLKNAQYATDLMNKQAAYALDLQAQQQKADDELAIYTKLNEDKLALDQQYTKFFWDEVKKQMALVDSLIAKMRELASAKGSAWASWNWATTTNNTQNNTINVANNVDVNAVTTAVNSWLH